MSRRRNGLTLCGAILFILWVAFAVAYYFVIHKPWWDHLRVAPFAALLDILLAIALVSLAGGIGRQILSTLEGTNALERVALEVALGLGILSLVVLMVGLLGLISRWLAWIGLVGGLVGFRNGVLAWWGTWRAISRNSGRINLLGKFAFGFVLLLWILNLLWALAPPLKWDSLVYHLQIPAKYVAAGRIFYYPENLYAGFPQLAGMLYTWAIALGSVTTATTLCWAVSLVMFVGVEGFSRRILGKGVAWMAPALLLSGFSISGAMHWAYVDLWIMFFGLLTLLCLDIYLSSRKRLWLILAAAMVGFAIGTKYTAGVSLVIAAILLLWGWITNWRRGNERDDTVDRQPVSFLRLLTDWAILAGITLIIASPWLLKNWFETSNPFHPAPFFTDGLNPWS